MRAATFALVDATTLASYLVALLLALRARAIVRSWRARWRMMRARAGEDAARALLARRGYVIVDAQVPGELVLCVDGARSVHGVRADYLVERGGARWVAEVKTGTRAPSLDHRATRRQILEYCAAFDVDGALLVDASAGTVHQIALPWRRRARIVPIAIGVAVGVVLAVLLR
jgi:hypothetical protein